MSKNGDEDEDDECFYESHDRLVSSSCSCSTSNSDSDNDSNSCSPNYGSEHVFSVPKFPAGVSNYDLWVAEPSSVSERRNRLLQEMGLSKDPALSRVKFVSDDRGSDSMEFTRLVLSDHLNRQAQRNAIILSKSNAASNRIVSQHNRPYHHVDNKLNSSSSSSVYSPSILSSHLVDGTSSSVNTRNHSIMKSQSSKDDGTSSVGSATLPNKPPLGKVCKRLDEIRSDSAVLDASSDPNRFPSHGNEGIRGEVSVDLDCNGIGKVDDQVCTIKDLDNGKEFIVNEIREDGMWNKLKEVGTGRQMTMEEFEMCVGHSPIVQELMRRQNVEDGNKDNVHSCVNGSSGGSSKLKKKGGWLKGIKSVANTMTGQKERRSSDERDTSSEKGGRRSSSATDDSQDISFHGPERVKVRQYGKSNKELTALYKSQEIQAHTGSIWTIKFSLDGKYLATAGEDRVIHVWQVLESERKGELLGDKSEDGNLNFLFLGSDSPEPTSLLLNMDNYPEKKRRGRSSLSRKSMSFEHVVVPETIFAISEKPVCSFQGHLDVVVDLSWSKSQHLLSSSMDKTVRLWNLSSKSCLKIFSHSDFVTCIQFNPVDDRYFISGSLDAKVRIWSVPDRQVVDWSDLHEMVTAACYTPDGQGALVGSYKGSCRLYNTSDNKLQPKSHINLQNKKKKSNQKKITGFQLLTSFNKQFAPGSSSEVLITSADSRIRVVDGVELVHKFKGFRNANRQISAYLTADGKYVVSASEDSHVYIWKHEAESRPIRSKSVTDTYSYEYFHCPDVTVAVPWPGITDTWEFHNHLTEEQNEFDNNLEDVSTANHPPTPVEDVNDQDGSLPASSGFTNSPLHSTISSVTNSFFFDRISATWPEEKLQSSRTRSSPQISSNISNGANQNSSSAWGMVIVTAGLQGELRTFQNFGLPIRL